jgi:hypothetical protein
MGQLLESGGRSWGEVMKSTCEKETRVHREKIHFTCSIRNRHAVAAMGSEGVSG